MERTSQVILRNASRLRPGPVLLVNPPRDSLFRDLEQGGWPVQISTQDFGDCRWLQSSGASVTFDAVPEPLTPCASIILNLPREKERLGMMLHALAAWMSTDTALWVVGENRAGIKSAGRHLERCFQSVSKLDSARHCGVFEATGPRKDTPFTLSDYAEHWPVEFGGKRIEVVSLPGVFAHGRLDNGSRLLLQTLEKLQPSDRILDFACGSGVIGCSLLAMDTGAELTLLDVSALALESSRLTLVQNGLKGALLASDGLSELEGKYDWVISNPPFHRGVSNDLEIAAEFFRRAGTFLSENGRIVIVCNRHLPYASWLRNHFEQVLLLDENAEFVIIQAGKPRST